MPEMTGIEMLSAVRERSPETTGVMLTGYCDSAMGHPVARDVVREMIEKPWNDRSLKRTVRHLLRERELRKRRG
jgi:FixJ family two-component response regulator